MDIGISSESVSTPEGIATTVRDAGARPDVDDIGRLVRKDLDALVVRGRDDIAVIARSDRTVPALVVEDPVSLSPIPRQEISAAIDAMIADTSTIVEHPTIATELGERRQVLGIGDASLMTTEPASISEFSIRWEGEEIGRYRADGVIVATPVGSADYAHAAGGPVVAPTVQALTVVPIAPYHLNPDHWVLDGTVQLEVSRDEGEVGLYVDGTQVEVCSVGTPVRMRTGPTYQIIQVSSTRSAIERNEG